MFVVHTLAKEDRRCKKKMHPRSACFLSHKPKVVLNCRLSLSSGMQSFVLLKVNWHTLKE